MGLLLPNSPTFVIFYFGVLKAGEQSSTSTRLYSLEEIEFQIRDSDPKVMVTLDLALLFEKVEALLEAGALEKGGGGQVRLALASLKQVGLSLSGRVKRARIGASRMRRKIVLETAFLIMTGTTRGPLSRRNRLPSSNIPAARRARPRGQCSRTRTFPSTLRR